MSHTSPHTLPRIDSIDAVPVRELVSGHGSPLFVFSEKTLRANFQEASRAFVTRYPNTRFAWSYKTNYLRAICALFHQEGTHAEVVSEFEYDKARALGVPGSEIIYNGPHKPAAMLTRAVADSAQIQIDNFDELAELTAVAAASGRVVDVAIRVHKDIGHRPVWTKFGFDSDSNATNEALARIKKSGCLRLNGLHTHIGTSVLDPRVYTRATLHLLDLAKTAQAMHGFRIEYLNLGGGFASRSSCPTGAPDQDVPSMDEYAEAIVKPILYEWPLGTPFPRLYLESGRALVDDAGYLITSVVARKPGAGVVVDAGLNLISRECASGLRIHGTHAGSGQEQVQTVFGNLCMNTDVIAQFALLPELQPGDHLVLHPMGAYHLSQSMQFIAYRPRVVLVTTQGNVEVIREREDLRHVEALERWPEFLSCVDRTDSQEAGAPPASSPSS